MPALSLGLAPVAQVARLALGAALCGAVAIASWSSAALPSSHGLTRMLDAAFEALLPAAEAAQSTLPDLNDGRSAVSARWRHSMASFARSDAERMPAAGGVVFVGSSSISLWSDLETRFASPSTPVVKRGLGGARMADCALHVDRLVLPYRPRLVVVYAGDNDLAEGVSPESVLDAYVAFVGHIHAVLPETRVAFISIKPSPLREALAPLARRANALLAEHSHTDPRLDYIDIHSAMLDANGHPRAELFQSDGLHPSAAGYAQWAMAIAAHLQ